MWASCGRHPPDLHARWGQQRRVVDNPSFGARRNCDLQDFRLFAKPCRAYMASRRKLKFNYVFISRNSANASRLCRTRSHNITFGIREQSRLSCFPSGGLSKP